MRQARREQRSGQWAGRSRARRTRRRSFGGMPAGDPVAQLAQQVVALGVRRVQQAHAAEAGEAGRGGGGQRAGVGVAASRQ